MCEIRDDRDTANAGTKTVPVDEAVGMVLCHDITEIRAGEFKGRAFKKGHIVRREDIGRLKQLGKEHLFILQIKEDEMHENDAAFAIAKALAGPGVCPEGEPAEGKINLIADRDGLLKVRRDALLEFNMLGEVMCATLHSNSVVRKGQVVAGTRAIPLVVKKAVIEKAVRTAEAAGGVVTVRQMRRPRAGIVITGNEVYYGRVKDAFEKVITGKIKNLGGEITGVYFAPDDAKFIEGRIRALAEAGADLIITTGGMSVDPDDVTRFAIRNTGAQELLYGSPVLPGAMFLVAYCDIEPAAGPIPVVGIPACGMYAAVTVFDLILPRILAGERIGRRELAELGHGGLCLKCRKCRYPVCPFGK
ncbi:MAG: molybdopterin-binding protein [Deferribacteres bacterium]|nr:molybdopterin-binding protein [Deferribacteres bacterium]